MLVNLKKKAPINVITLFILLLVAGGARYKDQVAGSTTSHSPSIFSLMTDIKSTGSLLPTDLRSSSGEHKEITGLTDLKKHIYLPSIALASSNHASDNGQFTKFAVIGDYGKDGEAETATANLIKNWKVDFIITTGDNNYDDGSSATIDQNIGKYYSNFIYPYQGNYTNSGEGAIPANRFFPILGNHDWRTANAQPYLDYFSLPGNERYYDFTWGSIHFFALDSNDQEPDGVSKDSRQALWLKDRLASSKQPWKIVYLHHPPFSSGKHGSTLHLQWPYKEWGATAVIAGHDHSYERIMQDNFPYFVNGLGGDSIYPFKTVIPGSAARYNNDYGAMLIQADNDTMTFQFYSITGELIDEYTITR